MLATCVVEASISTDKATRHITILSTLEGFFGLLKGEFFHGLDWSGVSLGEFQARLRDYLVGFVTTRLKAFGGSTAACYRTIEGRRAELGLPSTLAA